MKALKIDFSPPVMSPQLYLLWCVAVLIAGLVLWFGEQHVSHVQQSNAELAQEVQSLDRQLEFLKKDKTPSATHKIESLQKAGRVLSLDLNAAFAAFENVRVNGASPRAFSLETATGSIQLEYEVQTLAIANALTREFNMGYAMPPWRLENVSALDINLLKTGPSVTSSLKAPMYRAALTANLANL